MSKRGKPELELKIGDLVLIGRPGISMPGDWWEATVICVSGDEIATAHIPAGQSETQRQFIEVSYVRAVGSHPFLRDFKERARTAVTELKADIDKAEQALRQARDAVWARLDEIAAAKPPVEVAGGFV